VLEECEHGEEAMAVLAQAQADLVITDLQMPRLGGEAFLLGALERGLLRSSSVIVLSSAITPKVIAALAPIQRLTFLRKPATGDEISRAIRAHFGGSLVKI